MKWTRCPQCNQLSSLDPYPGDLCDRCWNYNVMAKEQVGEGVRAILRELDGPRHHGDTVGGTITSLERALVQKFVELRDGQFTLTDAGRAYIAAADERRK